jgi:hypothetical protein
MCSFKFFNQNVCTVSVHEMHYKFNPGPSPPGLIQARISLVVIDLMMFNLILDLAPQG